MEANGDRRHRRRERARRGNSETLCIRPLTNCRTPASPQHITLDWMEILIAGDRFEA